MAGDLKSELQSKVLNGAVKPAKSNGPIKRTKNVVTPVFTKQLAEKVGHSKGSRMLGLSSGYLHTAIARDEVSAVAEVAAKGLLDEMKRVEMKENPPESVYIAMRIPHTKMAGFQTVVEAMGLKLRILD